MSAFEYADRHPWWSLVFLVVIGLTLESVASRIGRGLARRGRT